MCNFVFGFLIAFLKIQIFIVLWERGEGGLEQVKFYLKIDFCEPICFLRGIRLRKLASGLSFFGGRVKQQNLCFGTWENSLHIS